MLKNILNVGKPLSKIQQRSINGGNDPQSENQGETETETVACYHCGLWVPCDVGYNSNIPCGITPL